MKKLFIVCPFSCLELFLQNKFGNDILFATSNGAMLPYGDTQYLTAIGETILQEKITDIYIVTDTSCRFLNNIFSGKPMPRFPAVTIMEDLFIEHYFTHFKNHPAATRPLQLAGLYIQKQMHRLTTAPVLQTIILDNNVRIHGLITDKQHSLIRIINNTGMVQSENVKWLPELELN